MIWIPILNIFVGLVLVKLRFLTLSIKHQWKQQRECITDSCCCWFMYVLLCCTGAAASSGECRVVSCRTDPSSSPFGPISFNVFDNFYSVTNWLDSKKEVLIFHPSIHPSIHRPPLMINSISFASKIYWNWRNSVFLWHENFDVISKHLELKLIDCDIGGKVRSTPKWKAIKIISNMVHKLWMRNYRK